MQNSVLLEIFRTVLMDNLPKYEASITIGLVDPIRTRISAIQAIRSAAKVISLNSIVDLCKSMEDFLKKSLELNEPIGELSDNFFVTVGEILKEFTEINYDLIPVKESEKSIVIVDLTKYFEKASSGLKPKQIVIPEKEVKVEPRLRGIDPMLIGLFKTEMNIHVTALFELLKSEGECDKACLNNLSRAAHSIKGAAKITGFNSSADLAGKMEGFFNSVLAGEVSLSLGAKVVLIEAAEFYASLAIASDEQVVIKASDINLISKLIFKLDSLKNQVSEPKKQPIPTSTPPQIEKKEMKIDLSMVDLFKMELESHTKVLEKGLVDAEGETSKEKLEPLMRAAHSIKGAARIVGINLVVGLAHSMEDLLSLAIKGEILITDKHIDLLLQGNDFFKFVATLTAEEILPEVESNLEFINSISASLAAAAKGEVSHTPKIIKQTDSNEPVQQPNLRKERKEDALFVRVLADNLNRLLGLAGEIKIQAKFTKPFHNYLLAAKQTLREASRLNESLNSRIEELGLTEKFADKLDGFQEVTDRLETNISIIIEKFEIFSRNIERLSDSLGNEVIASKMRPISDGLHGIPRMVRDVAKDTGKKIQFEIIGEDTMIDRDILDKIEAPLSHLITNAIDHGIELPETRIAKGKPETGKIILEAGHRAGFLNISVIDNGKGIDENIIRKKIVEKGYVSAEMAENLSKVEILDFLFLPGFTTTTGVTKVSGRGVGLDIVMSLIHQVGGKSKVDSEPGIGSVFTLQLPVTLSVIRSLLIKINSELYALPLARVETLLSIREEDILTLEDRQYYKWNDENLGIVNCAQLMSLPGEGAKGQFINLAVIGDRTGKYAVAVDAFLGERDLVVTAIDRKLGKIPNIYAAAILEEGSIALIIDPDDLLRSIENYIKGAKPDKISIRSVLLGKTKKVLVVDDSLTVREVERKLIENNGYKVVTAVDGVDGFNTLQKEDFDLVITDVDMPRMNGIQLVEKIKSDPKFKDIPVMIVSYKDREEDRLRGLNAGANYYLTKSSFHDESLINAVVDLIGEAK